MLLGCGGFWTGPRCRILASFSLVNYALPREGALCPAVAANVTANRPSPCRFNASFIWFRFVLHVLVRTSTCCWGVADVNQPEATTNTRINYMPKSVKIPRTLLYESLPNDMFVDIQIPLRRRLPDAVLCELIKYPIIKLTV